MKLESILNLFSCTYFQKLSHFKTHLEFVNFFWVYFTIFHSWHVAEQQWSMHV